MKTSSVIVVAAGVVGLLFGCAVTPVEQAAGGDDFPNMIASAGTAITRNLDQRWENPAAASTDALSGITKAEIPDVSTTLSLGKRVSFPKRTAADSVRFIIDSTGIITAFLTSVTDSSEKHDTLVVRVVGIDTLLVALKGSIKKLKFPQPVEYYQYVDIDGDSILINPAAQKQQALIFYQKQSLGRVETITLTLDAGIDRDFDNESDNRCISFTSLVTMGADTIAFAQIRDTDDDGFVLGKGSATDSSIVDIVTQSNPLLDPANYTTARMVVFPADSAKNYAIRYGVVNRFAGRSVRWSIVENGGDSSFFPGDTVKVTRIVEPAGSDSTIADTLQLRAVLGADPCDSLDETLIGIELHSTFRTGADREVFFKWTAVTPLKNGETPRDGTLYYKSAFADGQWLEATGTINETVITAEVLTSGGTRYEVSWDSSGKQLSVRKLSD